MKKKVGVLFLLLGILMLGGCKESLENTGDAIRNYLTDSSEINSIESEENNELNSETVSLTEEETKLQAAFDKLTNNGEGATITQVKPLVFEIRYKVPLDTDQDSNFSYTLIEEAVTEAYGEHDPITVRIYDENGELVATNENSENYWEMQEVE